MTGATILASTDHMIQQRQDDCLGRQCGYFWLRQVNNNPEKLDNGTNRSASHTQRILKKSVARGSAYVYLQGCPAERGCTLVLRGDSREKLAEIKRMLRFCVMLAYHLRLEVAYYDDRCAELPLPPDTRQYDDDSDEEEEMQLMQDSFEYNEPREGSFSSQDSSGSGRTTASTASMSIASTVGGAGNLSPKATAHGAAHLNSPSRKKLSSIDPDNESVGSRTDHDESASSADEARPAGRHARASAVGQTPGGIRNGKKLLEVLERYKLSISLDLDYNYHINVKWWV